MYSSRVSNNPCIDSGCQLNQMLHILAARDGRICAGILKITDSQMPRLLQQLTTGAMVQKSEAIPARRDLLRRPLRWNNPRPINRQHREGVRAS